MWRYPEFPLKRKTHPDTVDTNLICDPRRSSTRNVRRDRGMCDLISRCRGTMVPASASARRSTPASRDPALSEGTKDAEGGGGRPPDVPSEIAYAAIREEVATLPAVLGHHRDRRRYLEHHLEEGNRRWGSLSARLRPVSDVCPPCTRSGDEVEVDGTRGERAPRYDLAQDFEMVYDTRRTLKPTELSFSSAIDFVSHQKKKNDCD